MSEAYWAFLDGEMVQGLSLIDLANKYGTPLYVYDLKTIKSALNAYLDHPKNPKVYYAVKANSNLTLIAKMAEWGAGFDIVSQGELMRVLKAGGRAADVVFSGVAKTEEEIRFALEVGVGCINIESENELYRLSEIATGMDKTAKIALRVNPNVDAQTHPYISTGMKDNKFGISIEIAADLYRKAAKMSGIEIVGVGCHIGSQITTITPFLEAFNSLRKLADTLTSEGITIHHIDIGGGLGIQMKAEQSVPTPKELVDLLYQSLEGTNYQLHLQPGRSIVGNSALLLAKIVGLKEQSGKHFVMLDAAMNDYIRPALYQAIPPMRNLSRTGEVKNVDVVGPICESGDTFAKNISLVAKSGDVIAIAGVGAYGMSMSSQYNTRPRAAEILIENGKAILIRKRETYEQLWENEIIAL